MLLMSIFQTQAGETGPFIDEILSGLNSIICDLSPQQVHVFYEAVGCLISAQTDPAIRENLIERLMQLPNSIWEEIISHASQVEDFLVFGFLLVSVFSVDIKLADKLCQTS